MKKRPPGKSRSSDARRYRQLLTGEWTDATLADALELAGDLLGGQVAATPVDSATNHRLLEKIQSLMPLIAPLEHKLSIRSQLAKAWTARKSREQLRLTRLILRIAHVLCAQWMESTVPRDPAFFKDVQSLLFLCALDVLAPRLDSNAMKQERALLVAAMLIHLAAWSNDAAHQQYLRARLYDYLDMRDEEELALKQAALLTPPSEHDFITKAQAAWMALMDHGKPREARDFLLEIYRRAPLESLEELREMLDETAPPTNATGRAQFCET